MNRLFAILAILCFSLPVFAGVVYTATTRSQTGDAIAMTSVRGYIQGRDARLEFLEGSSISPGTYILTRDAGATFIQVDPDSRVFTRWQAPPQTPLAQQAEAKAAKTTVTEPKFEKVLDEDGGLILGIKTRHVRFKTSYTFTITLMRPHTTHIMSEDDIWITQQVNDPGLKHWLGTNLGDQVDPLIRNEMSKIDGIPLKRITVLTSIEEDGESETTRTEMNVTQLKQQTLPASKFIVPATYKEKSAPTQPAEADPHDD